MLVFVFCLQHAQVLLGLEDFDGAVLVGRSDDDLGKDFLDLLGHLHGDLAVDGDDAAEGGHRVTRMRRAVGGGDGLFRNGNATRIGVLNNCNAGALVVPSGAPGGIRILVVVVAHLLAVELGGIGKARRTDAGDGGLLVGVFAIAQRGGLAFLAQLVHKPGGDGRIIIRGMQEGVAGQAAALL